MEKYFTYYVDENHVFHLYDKYERKHFESYISPEHFDLFLNDKISFINQMKIFFDDVFEKMS